MTKYVISEDIMISYFPSIEPHQDAFSMVMVRFHANETLEFVFSWKCVLLKEQDSLSHLSKKASCAVTASIVL